MPKLAPLAHLAHLSIKEVSGVDDPANEMPGWMVAKSAATDIAEVRAQLEILRAYVANYSVLEHMLKALDGIPVAERGRVIKMAAAELPEGVHKRHAHRHSETGRFTERPVPTPRTGLFAPAKQYAVTGGSFFGS